MARKNDTYRSARRNAAKLHRRSLGCMAKVPHRFKVGFFMGAAPKPIRVPKGWDMIEA